MILPPTLTEERGDDAAQPEARRATKALTAVSEGEHERGTNMRPREAAPTVLGCNNMVVVVVVVMGVGIVFLQEEEEGKQGQKQRASR